MHALIFEDALSFRKQVHALIFDYKNILRNMHALILEHEMTLNEKYFGIKMRICNLIFCNNIYSKYNLIKYTILASRCALYNLISGKQQTICIYYINICLVTRRKKILTV